jgi:GNAT superfamily N-acetyltransferase
VTATYTIRLARPRDLLQVPIIECAAAQLLRGHAPESVLHETTSHAELDAARRLGHLWVAVADETPVGFAHVETLDTLTAHLKEIDVLPSHGRRGVGTSLVSHVCRWAASAGYLWVTLTTFRNVPWNMPFYLRLGFRVVDARDYTPVLSAIVDDEGRRGLDSSRRVVMKRFVSGSSVTPS